MGRICRGHVPGAVCDDRNRLHAPVPAHPASSSAQVAVKNHYNGARNPIAQFQQEITILIRCSDPRSSPILSASLTARPSPMARQRSWSRRLTAPGSSPIPRSGCGQVPRQAIPSPSMTGGISAPSMHPWPPGSVHSGWPGLSPADIDLVEVHDCFTIAEICAIEDLGFCRKGEAGRITEEGVTALDGDLPVNTSGGLKACGHPVGCDRDQAGLGDHHAAPGRGRKAADRWRTDRDDPQCRRDRGDGGSPYPGGGLRCRSHGSGERSPSATT